MPPGEPGAFRALADVDAATHAREDRRRARVAFAVAWVVASACAVVADEAGKWHHVYDLGVDVGFRGGNVVVDAGSAAAAAGLVSGRRLLFAGGEPAHRLTQPEASFLAPTPDVIVGFDNRLYLRAALPATTVATSPPDDDRDAAVCSAVVVVASGEPRVARDLRPPGTYGAPALLAAFLLACVVAAVARRVRPTASPATSLERSVVWPAAASAIVLPMWAHQLAFQWAVVSDVAEFYPTVAVVTTGVAHVALVVLIVGAARRWCGCDFTTRPQVIVLVVAAIVPGVALVVPTVLVLLLSWGIHHGLRRWARRVVDEPA